MENIINNSNSGNGRKTAGIIILLIGCLLLTNQLNLFFIPHWLFSWPMWLIAFGIYQGAKHNFSKPVHEILIALGIIFLITENVNNSGDVVWPLAIIGTGLWMVLKPKVHLNRTFKEV